MKLDRARRIVEHVVAAAPAPLSVFVADTHGELVAAATMDGAAPDTRLNAQRKAYTAARSDARTTRELAEKVARRPGRARELRPVLHVLPRRRRRLREGRPRRRRRRQRAAGRRRRAARARRDRRDAARARPERSTSRTRAAPRARAPGRARRRARAAARASPRIASLRFSSSSRYESSRSISIRSTPSVAAKLDHRVDAVPRVVEEERAFAADRLELVAAGHRRAAVEASRRRRRGSASSRRRPSRCPTARTTPRPTRASGSPAEQPRAGDVVTADVHERAALDVGAGGGCCRGRRASTRTPSARAAARRSLRRRRAPRAASSAGCAGT